MSQVFISYSRDNRDTAQYAAQALAALGIDVWWDRELPGGSEFSEVIERELTQARVAIVLWSESSIRSSFVRDEATRAFEAGKLLPVRIEPVVPPLGFGQIHALDLLGWNGDDDDPSFATLVDEVRKRLGQPLVARQRFVPPQRIVPPERQTRAPLIAGVVVLLSALLAVGGVHVYNSFESRRNLSLGLEEQFGRDPNLQAARNYYLDALEHMSDNARARYYLGHVYAQLGELELARAAFERAVKDREGLDNAQLADAKARIAALTPAAEPAPVARAVVTTVPPSVVQPPDFGVRPPKTDAKPAPPPDVNPPVKAPTVGPRPATPPDVGPETIAKLKTARPPTVPPAPDAKRRAAELVDRLFSEDRETRIAATTDLVTDPELLSDAVALAVDEANGRLATSGGTPSAAVQAGVVNTLVVLKAAMPGALVANRADIERLLKSARPLGKVTALQVDKVQALLASAADRRPVAFIQIANEAQRPIAELLEVKLRAAGYDAPGIELVGARAPASSQVRVQGKSDRGFARWLAKVVGEADGQAVAVQTLRNASPTTDTFEIWFDRDLCTAGRSVPKCGS